MNDYEKAQDYLTMAQARKPFDIDINNLLRKLAQWVELCHTLLFSLINVERTSKAFLARLQPLQWRAGQGKTHVLQNVFCSQIREVISK